MNQEKFGIFICTLRKEKGLTQKELGEILGVSDKAISKWERGASLPDITMFEKISDALDVSTLELMQGQRIIEEKVERIEAEKLITETVGQAVIQEKKTKKRTVLCTLLVVVSIFLFFTSLKYIINFALDKWADIHESLAHSCEISTYFGNESVENYYISVECVEEFIWDYHLYGMDAEGNSAKILTLRENGMKLDRNPKVIQRDNYVYLLFEGLDNEDPVERIYSGKMGADPQGFLPYLYRYDIEEGTIKEIKISQENETMLVDAIFYEGEDIYISQHFRGVIGGLHLGFYMGDTTRSSSGIGKSYENLFGDGGLKSTGCVDGDWYYIVGQKGIYKINLATNEGSYQISEDFSYCYRSEIKKIDMNEKKYFVVATSFFDETDMFGQASSMRTVISLYDEEWNEIKEIELPYGISAVEWGKESAIVTVYEFSWRYRSYLVDFKNGTAHLIEEPINEIDADMEHLDEAECLAEQWVYVPSKQGYYYTSEIPVFITETKN